METVIVACKIVSGVRISEDFTAAGPKPIPPEIPFNLRPSRPGGFQLTRDCPKDVWDSWFSVNAKSPMVKNGLIFADADEAVVRRHCILHKNAQSGLEQTPRGWKL